MKEGHELAMFLRFASVLCHILLIAVAELPQGLVCAVKYDKR